MATLTSDITADDRLALITGDTSAAVPGNEYRIDDEVVTLRDFEKVDINGNPDYRGTRNRNRWIITRGDADSTPASHTAGASIVATVEAVAVSTTLVPPTPFAGSGEGGGAEAPLALTGTDPTAVVASLTAAPGQDSLSDADLFFVAAPDGDKIMRVRADGHVLVDMAAQPGLTTTGMRIEGSGSSDILILTDGNAGILDVFPGGAYLSGNRAADNVLFVEPLVALNAGVSIAAFAPASGSNRVYITRGAYIKFKATAAPADTELSANEVAFWFDSTNGAAKLMVKGKQANGTVVSGEVPLT